MKNKLVIWGTNAANEKVLIALELQASANKVTLYTFPEAITSDDFVNKMMNEWRKDQPVEFPEGYTTLEQELSVTESLLPEDLKVERGDIIQRAQTEWHFSVLSAKLHAAYEQELAEFKEKIQGLSTYDNKTWEGLRSFWDKVQSQSRDRNLFREHADSLRDNINVLFEDLKKMRSRVQDEFMTASSGVYDEFNKSLEDIEKRIAAGGNKLNSVFDELKQMQRRYREARMSNEHRNVLWERIDAAFKAAKERKFGPAANEGTVAERHERRLEGLLEAIRRMEDSIRRDEEELGFQQKKVDSSEGQLEAQIRKAKIKMIEERAASKRDKLTEMNQTRSEIERQANSARDKEAKRAEKETEKQKMDAAKEAAKSEIASSIKSKAPKKESLLDAVGTVLGEVLEDAIDTAKAVASVVAEKADDVIDQVSDKAEEIVDAMKKEKDESDAETVATAAEEAKEDIKAAEEEAPKAAEEDKKEDA